MTLEFVAFIHVQVFKEWQRHSGFTRDIWLLHAKWNTCIIIFNDQGTTSHQHKHSVHWLFGKFARRHIWKEILAFSQQKCKWKNLLNFFIVIVGSYYLNYLHCQIHAFLKTIYLVYIFPLFYLYISLYSGIFSRCQIADSLCRWSRAEVCYVEIPPSSWLVPFCTGDATSHAGRSSCQVGGGPADRTPNVCPRGTVWPTETRSKVCSLYHKI